HQSAAFYRLAGGPAIGLAAMRQRHGPELGYNNLLDFSAALGLLLEFDEPAAVVIKHTNPCGAALGPTGGAAMQKAKASDPISIPARSRSSARARRATRRCAPFVSPGAWPSTPSPTRSCSRRPTRSSASAPVR